MSGMSLTWAAQATGGVLSGEDTVFHGVCTDSRVLKPGELFIALSGPNFDAHGFIEEARAKGASAALVSEPVDTALATIRVDDTRLALGRLATAWRRRFNIPVIAVTGSNGKTTVKEMTAAILNVRGATLATRGNLNNDIGVPLTLLGLEEAHRYAVIEMGANHPGEIAYLTKLAQPTVALVNNAAPAHLEGFGSIEGVARAKGEIYSGLNEQGAGIVNADDHYAALWRNLVGKRRMYTFGMEQPADFTARPDSVRIKADETVATAFEMHAPEGIIDITLHLCGRHNVMNALAAAAAAYAVGADLQDIRQGLASVRAVSGRLQLKRGVNGVRLIDDTYNANPASLNAAIEVLAGLPGEKILALGDMGELGETSAQLHAEAGAQARASGIDGVYAVGELSRLTVESFGGAGHHYDDHAGLIEALRARLMQKAVGNVTVLVKGSRRMRMEQVAEALMAECPSGNRGG